MILMSVDQSTTHTAIIIWREGKPVFREMIQTGLESTKGRKKGVIYFGTRIEQIKFIIGKIDELIKSFQVTDYVMEALSFGSIGNATRDLAGLFYCIQYFLLSEHFDLKHIHTIAPTSVKSFARDFLPVELQTESKEKVDKKTGKVVVSTAKTKMDKDQMIIACENDYPGWLNGVTKTAGKADYADSYFIGKKLLSDKGEL